jgi:hypothetical protein
LKDPSDLKYLWSTPGGRYALVRCGSDEELMPFDLLTKSATVIEDDELADYVIEQMRNAGVADIDPPKDPI